MHYDKLSKYDKIIIETSEEMERIIEWSHVNWERINKDEFKLPILQGVVSFPTMSYMGMTSDSDLYFNVKDDRVEYKFFIDQELFAEFDMMLSDEQMEFENIDFKLKKMKLSNEEVKKMCSVTALNFAYIMQYFIHFSNNDNVIKEAKVRNVSKKRSNNKKKGKNNRNRVVIGSKRVCRVYAPADLNTNVRKYERHTEGWTVRGYWRFYKKSKKWGWVNGHPKGDKRNITPKEYQLK